MCIHDIHGHNIIDISAKDSSFVLIFYTDFVLYGYHDEHVRVCRWIRFHGV